MVHEHVPAERVRVGWLMRRGLRSYGTYSVCRRELGGWKTLPVSIAKGLVRIAIGVVLIPTGLVRGKTGVVDGLLQISRGAGRILGWFGKLPREYARPVTEALPR